MTNWSGLAAIAAGVAVLLATTAAAGDCPAAPGRETVRIAGEVAGAQALRTELADLDAGSCARVVRLAFRACSSWPFEYGASVAEAAPGVVERMRSCGLGAELEPGAWLSPPSLVGDFDGWCVDLGYTTQPRCRDLPCASRMTMRSVRAAAAQTKNNT